MNAEVTLQIVAMILQYGPSAVQIIANQMNQNKEITAEDIKNLFIDKDPEDYFK